MSIKKHLLFPKQRQILAVFGENLKLARKRRKLTSQQVAERAGIDRGTLREVERGNPGVSFSPLLVFSPTGISYSKPVEKNFRPCWCYEADRELPTRAERLKGRK